ncbi:DUF748 domain-containing protein [Nitrospira moscoviensis]|uniref:DUF748 domain-containing protein n=1 Tax=Nitrospira moscoviensis TaxID=42253 RepID=A0A0K2GEB1_NITMO|nr:DUF748 domain-containing protein [Nitrospira moscoviensis]ALA59204.1 exported protein of unknown function [Nitrospira moscoviensis]
MPRRHRGWIIAGIAAALLVLLVAIGARLAEDPLRRYAEGLANEALPDYRITIGELDLHPLTLAAELRDVVVRLQAHPEPPLADVPEVRADARLLPLFTGKLGADVYLERPALSATKQQVDALLGGGAPKQTAVWQDQVRDLAPFRLALFVHDGEVTYEGPPVEEPVRVHGLIVTAENLTNRPGEDERYPAKLQVRANTLEQAQVSIDGGADPLAKPTPAVEADVQLSGLDVRPALKAIGQADAPVKAGTVEAEAHVEYGPARQAVTVRRIAIQAPKIDYAAHPESGKIRKDVRETAVEAEAWQDRITALFPITIKEASVQDGEVIYRPRVDGDALRIHDLDVTASNIHNRPSESPEFPSDIRAVGRLEKSARITLEGRADFFAQPLPGVDAQVQVEDLRLAGLRDVAEPFNVQLRQGRLDLSGRVTYTHAKAKLLLDRFLLEDAKIDYVHRPGTKAEEAARAGQVAEQAKKAQRDPTVQIRVGHGQVLNSEMGFVNKAASPDYRVYMAEMHAEMDNFDTRPEQGTGAVKVTGKFMGSGPTVVMGTFRPEKPAPDFDLKVKIVKTKVTALNDVLRAYGNVDTHGGVFAFFSELSVRDNRIDGYVKPLLRDVEVYDPEKDKDKALTHKMYQAVVGGVLGLLENRPRDEVATKTDVSGELEDPQASTWQIIGNLVQNAFFKAILPGFAQGAVG